MWVLSMLEQPEVFASFLEGSLNVVATAIPSIAGLVLSRRYFDKKKTEQACLDAYYEIRFLQSVEAEAVEQGDFSKVALRKAAREKYSLDSSGLFKPSVLKRKIQSLERRVEGESPYQI